MLNFSFKPSNKAAFPLSHNTTVEHATDHLITLAQKARATSTTPVTQEIRNFNHIMQLGGRCFILSDFIALFTAYTICKLGAMFVTVYVEHKNLSEGFVAGFGMQQLFTFIVLGSMAILWLDSKGHYRQRLPYWEMLSHFASVAIVGLVFGGFVQYAIKDSFSRVQLGSSWIVFGCLLLIGRTLTRRLLEKRGLWQINTLIIGTKKTAGSIVKALLREKQMGYAIVSQMSAESLFHLKTSAAWKQLFMLYEANHVFIALEGSEIENHQSAIKAMVRSRIPYSIVPPWLGLPSSTASTHHFMNQDIMLMNYSCGLEQPLKRFVKRTFDILASGTALLLLSPVIVAIALLVRKDGGPIFFGHKRIGYKGVSFYCLKFRSMAMNGDEILQRHLAENDEVRSEWQRDLKLRNDPRVTTIGRFLRRSSLDELPQLWNVLRGDMSLVGPRPIVMAEIERYDSDIIHYYRVRPGITGMWQVSGRNDVTYENRVRMDSWYVRNWSLWHDVAIICKTFPVLLNRTGAY